MTKANYKTINSLMKRLRSNGASAKGSKEKRQLSNHGYCHAYKGYRYAKISKQVVAI